MRQLVNINVHIDDSETTMIVEGEALGEPFSFDVYLVPLKRIAAKAITAALRRLAK